jgi:citrate lyase alpha subunit
VEISTNVYANPGSKAASCDQLDVVSSARWKSTSISTST